MILKAAMEVPQIRYVGWDVAVTPNGPPSPILTMYSHQVVTAFSLEPYFCVLFNIDR